MQLQGIKCNTCGEEKEFSFFPKNKKCTFGLEKTCKSCKNKNNVRYQQNTNYEKSSAWQVNNKERHAGFCKQWRLVNKELRRFYSSNYRAKIKKALVPWADINIIKEIYQKCPSEHHVDHIIPLSGKLVSGLHVQNNLQYLPAFDNLSKGNKWEHEDRR